MSKKDLFLDSKTSIRVKTSFEALHHYPVAPAGVEDLRSLHRHIFHVSVKVEVFHDDREIEFFLFKHDIERVIKRITSSKGKLDGIPVLGKFSCEMIAKAIYKGLSKKYNLPTRDVEITISEDGNNEAVLEVQAWIERE